MDTSYQVDIASLFKLMSHAQNNVTISYAIPRSSLGTIYFHNRSILIQSSRVQTSELSPFIRCQVSIMLVNSAWMTPKIQTNPLIKHVKAVVTKLSKGRIMKHKKIFILYYMKITIKIVVSKLISISTKLGTHIWQPLRTTSSKSHFDTKYGNKLHQHQVLTSHESGLLKDQTILQSGKDRILYYL